MGSAVARASTAARAGAAVCRGSRAHRTAVVGLIQMGKSDGHRGVPTVGQAGQGALVGRQISPVMHADWPPLPLHIVVDVYVAHPGPLYGSSVGVAHALLVMQATCPPLPLQMVVGVYEAHVDSGAHTVLVIQATCPPLPLQIVVVVLDEQLEIGGRDCVEVGGGVVIWCAGSSGSQ